MPEAGAIELRRLDLVTAAPAFGKIEVRLGGRPIAACLTPGWLFGKVLCVGVGNDAHGVSLPGEAR